MAPQTGPREIHLLSQNWLFHPKHKRAHLRRECDEKGFSQVTIPHTVQQVPLSGFDEKSYQFVSTYRRHLRLPRKLRGKRIFLDFEGAMVHAQVYVNGSLAEEHLGGYTPFTVDLTDRVELGGDNVIAVRLDSTERADIPPFGGEMDYLAYGGIYRDVRLRVVEPLFVRRCLVKPLDVLKKRRRLVLDCHLENHSFDAGTEVELQVLIRQGRKTVLKGPRVPAALRGQGSQIVTMELADGLDKLALWDTSNPALYTAEIRLTRGGNLLDVFESRFGYRQCEFTPEGFKLNGKVLKLRGLNRHQTFPWFGAAAPARLQRRDAEILHGELKVNIVRTSHYPQSPDFLDRCDELGLLVFEEIPGWQHIGDQAWQALSIRDVGDMVLRDFNHPSIILWGVRINESGDNEEFYRETNRVAKSLDETRQTGGVRCFFGSQLLEDVYTMNDFRADWLNPSGYPRYLITEFCGHMYPTKHVDNVAVMTEHTRRHALIQSQAGSRRGISGAIGWCAFDYATHKDFGSGDRICHHGVADMFRIPKLAAGVYRAQCPPEEEIVLEPAFHWSIGDLAGGGGVGRAIVNSNCDYLVGYVGEKCVGEVHPDRGHYPGLPHPPFFLDNRFEGFWGRGWHHLRLEGYIGGKKVISRTLSGDGVDREFLLKADDEELTGDGVDMTRVTMSVADEFGNRKNLALGAILLEIDGPGEIVGDNPFALFGGCGAVWVRTKRGTGTIRLRATHPFLGSKEVRIRVPSSRRDAY